MYKTLLFLLLVAFTSCAKKKPAFNLQQDYFFVQIGGVISKLHLSNDTLYNYDCYSDRPCYEKPENYFKIISLKKNADFAVLKLEQLDTLQMNPIQNQRRYLIFILKNISEKELGYSGYLPKHYGLTKIEIDGFQINTDSLKEKFFFTYFSDSYYKELNKLKKITTKEDAEEIIEEANSSKYKYLADRYMNTKPYDMYGVGFDAEITNKACIEKGYSPIDAGNIIHKLMKPRSPN